jgi:triphosphoribosyl-dephospho-CoA synthase
MNPKILGKINELDVMDDTSLMHIKNEQLTLSDIFQKCADRDSICEEWISDFRTTFEVGYKYFRDALKSYDVNYSIVKTFLNILSHKPDSLINRKSGYKKAVEVSTKAKLLLEKLKLRSDQDLEMVWEFDKELQYAGGALNPGTTADITAASIFIALLEGWRP